MENARSMVLVTYVLHLVGAIAGVTSIIGLVFNYLQRGKVDLETATHHRWMIRSFWWAIVWIVVGFVTSWIVIGWFVLGGAWLWYVYRHVKGLIGWANEEPMPV